VLPVSDTIVFGQYDPAALTNNGKPISIFGAGSKVVVMDFHASSGTSEGVGNLVLAERAVDEENELRRR
jgi:hypothetical protein